MTFSRPDPTQIAALIRGAAVAEILPRFRHLAEGSIREKGPGQLVTDADVAAENLLRRSLTQIVPGSVVGEEGVADDPSQLDALNRPGPVWVVDPVDGTGNFVKGSTRFAVIVALVVDGKTIMGWIHDPVPDKTVFAEIGQGAWLNGQRLSVRPERPVSALEGSALRRDGLDAHVQRTIRGGSAAHDYLDLVLGRHDFALFSKLMPWDHAAGALIHAEAGGYSALLDDTPYCPGGPTSGRLLLAPSRRNWDELQALISRK